MRSGRVGVDDQACKPGLTCLKQPLCQPALVWGGPTYLTLLSRLRNAGQKYQNGIAFKPPGPGRAHYSSNPCLCCPPPAAHSPRSRHFPHPNSLLSSQRDNPLRPHPLQPPLPMVGASPRCSPTTMRRWSAPVSKSPSGAARRTLHPSSSTTSSDDARRAAATASASLASALMRLKPAISLMGTGGRAEVGGGDGKGVGRLQEKAAGRHMHNVRRGEGRVVC